MEMSRIMNIKPKIIFLPWKRAHKMATNTPNIIIFPLNEALEHVMKSCFYEKILDKFLTNDRN